MQRQRSHGSTLRHKLSGRKVFDTLDGPNDEFRS
jgi:hypothetical protein